MLEPMLELEPHVRLTNREAPVVCQHNDRATTANHSVIVARTQQTRHLSLVEATVARHQLKVPVVIKKERAVMVKINLVDLEVLRSLNTASKVEGANILTVMVELVVQDQQREPPEVKVPETIMARAPVSEANHQDPRGTETSNSKSIVGLVMVKDKNPQGTTLETNNSNNSMDSVMAMMLANMRWRILEETGSNKFSQTIMCRGSKAMTPILQAQAKVAHRLVELDHLVLSTVLPKALAHLMLGHLVME